MAGCKHLDAVETVNKGGTECQECVKTGDKWVHLRTCQACGVTLCCDSSKNRHAHAHFETHGHAVIASAEKNDYWLWCYLDKAFVQYS